MNEDNAQPAIEAANTEAALRQVIATQVTQIEAERSMKEHALREKTQTDMKLASALAVVDERVREVNRLRLDINPTVCAIGAAVLKLVKEREAKGLPPVVVAERVSIGAASASGTWIARARKKVVCKECPKVRDQARLAQQECNHLRTDLQNAGSRTRALEAEVAAFRSKEPKYVPGAKVWDKVNGRYTGVLVQKTEGKEAEAIVQLVATTDARLASVRLATSWVVACGHDKLVVIPEARLTTVEPARRPSLVTRGARALWSGAVAVSRFAARPVVFVLAFVWLVLACAGLLLKGAGLAVTTRVARGARALLGAARRVQASPRARVAGKVAVYAGAGTVAYLVASRGPAALEDAKRRLHDATAPVVSGQ